MSVQLARELGIIQTPKMNTEELGLTLFYIALGLIVLFFIVRELNCWYWKINARIEKQEKMADNLEKIQKELTFITDYIKKKDPTSQELEITGAPKISTDESK